MSADITSWHGSIRYLTIFPKISDSMLPTFKIPHPFDLITIWSWCWRPFTATTNHLTPCEILEAEIVRISQQSTIISCQCGWKPCFWPIACGVPSKEGSDFHSAANSDLVACFGSNSCRDCAAACPLKENAPVSFFYCFTHCYFLHITVQILYIEQSNCLLVSVSVVHWGVAAMLFISYPTSEWVSQVFSEKSLRSGADLQWWRGGAPCQNLMPPLFLPV